MVRSSGENLGQHPAPRSRKLRPAVAALEHDDPGLTPVALPRLDMEDDPPAVVRPVGDLGEGQAERPTVSAISVVRPSARSLM